VSSQYSYLRTLTLPLEERINPLTVAFVDLEESARLSGEGLLALARGDRNPFNSTLQTRDGHYVKPWVLMVQVINHATEHREQISSMLSNLGVTPPDLDGWSFGEATQALTPISK
jgi:uncharacterized damage-inducible protein DinB